ncbi:MAG TPA: M48 family metallopeptidase [candidate division Zixibacteria bacterium]|nr:M48 family metallopeptidase [candidate division Zixibacteria bacterium]
MLLVAAFLAFFALCGLAIDFVYFGAFTSGGPPFPVAAPAALVGSGLIAAGAYRFGDRLLLRSLGAEPLDPVVPEHRELRNVVTEMALASGCPMPGIWVIYDPAPNAFATGRDERSAAVCATTGLLALLNREETQGVVAHEMAHIKNNDTLLMMLVAVLLGAVALLSDWAQRTAGALPRRRGARIKLVFALPALLLIAISPLVSRLLAMAVSRRREYLADACAAEFTRNPLGLAKALEKIRDAGLPFHRAPRGTAHLFFVDPLRRRMGEREGRLADWLATHPPIEHRIELLYRMAGIPRASQARPVDGVRESAK